jgi:site-specific DNA-methyltransferase (adenine-specific)
MREHESIFVFSYGKPIYNPIMQERAESGSKRQKTPVKSNTCCSDPDMYGDIKIGAVEKKISLLRYPSSVQKFNRERGLHPTQKPVALCEYLIRTYTNEGMMVLDNCMGSGTTGVACLNTNRKFIGIERDETYFNVAKQRMESHQTPNIGE